MSAAPQGCITAFHAVLGPVGRHPAETFSQRGLENKVQVQWDGDETGNDTGSGISARLSYEECPNTTLWIWIQVF